MTPIAPSLQQPVDAFLRYLVERQLSPLTQLSYSRQLAALMRLAQEIGVTDWTALDAARCALAARSKRAGLQSASLALRLSSLRSFLDWLVSQGVLHATPPKASARRVAAAICRKHRRR